MLIRDFKYGEIWTAPKHREKNLRLATWIEISVGFFYSESSCDHRRLALQNWFEACTVIRVWKELAVRGCVGLYWAFAVITHTGVNIISDRGGTLLVGLLSRWFLPHFQICQTLWKGKLLFVNIYQSRGSHPATATQYSGSQENPEEWQLTLARRATKAVDQLQN